MLDLNLRDTVGGQHGRQETGRGTDTVVVEVLDREETEDSSGLECAANIIDELIIPVGLDVEPSGANVGRHGMVPETLATKTFETSSLKADAQDLDNLAQVAAARGVEDETLLEEDEKEGQGKVQE